MSRMAMIKQGFVRTPRRVQVEGSMQRGLTPTVDRETVAYISIDDSGSPPETNLRITIHGFPAAPSVGMPNEDTA